MISVLIPAYKEKEALDLCIRSCVEGCINNDVEIIVGVDGTYDILEPILQKWKNNIIILNPGQHIGLIRMTNYLVSQALYDNILLVNDDNVFATNWYEEISRMSTDNTVWSINQIEPYPSMFKQFVIQDFGRSPQEFDQDKFNKKVYSLKLNHTAPCETDDSGSILPVFMSKRNFIKVGGWDIEYPGPYVVDWDFFMKCRLVGYKMKRLYSTHMYHFVSLSTNSTPERQKKRLHDEIMCHEYAKYKWGDYIKNDPITNNKYIN